MAWRIAMTIEPEGNLPSTEAAGLLVNQKEEKDLCLARD
jgi:hypothetical protein